MDPPVIWLLIQMTDLPTLRIQKTTLQTVHLQCHLLAQISYRGLLLQCPLLLVLMLPSPPLHRLLRLLGSLSYLTYPITA